MLAASRDRPDVRRLEYGEGLLSGHRAVPLVGIGHHDAKGALAEARPEKRGLAVHGRRLGSRVPHESSAACDTFPERPTSYRGQVVGLPDHSVRREVVWDRNPVPLVKKERILEDDAANGVIRSGIVGYASVVLDSFVHDLASGSTVLNPERVPGERHRKDREG